MSLIVVGLCKALTARYGGTIWMRTARQSGWEAAAVAYYGRAEPGPMQAPCDCAASSDRRQARLHPITTWAWHPLVGVLLPELCSATKRRSVPILLQKSISGLHNVQRSVHG